jgi:Ca2+-binding RTX toxin-like protein
MLSKVLEKTLKNSMHVFSHHKSMCRLHNGDVIFGGPGHDLITGGWGDDVIDGGDGYDLCYGDGHFNSDTAVQCESVLGVP